MRRLLRTKSFTSSLFKREARWPRSSLLHTIWRNYDYCTPGPSKTQLPVGKIFYPLPLPSTGPLKSPLASAQQDNKVGADTGASRREMFAIRKLLSTV